MFAFNSFKQMQASINDIDGTAAETFSIRVPAGTRQRLERYRLERGFRSRNQAIYELLCAGFVVDEAV